MPRRYGTSILLPANPTAPLEAATKSYVDAADSAAASALAGQKGSGNGICPLDSLALVSPVFLPVVPTVVRAVTYSATVTINAATQGNVVEITATGNLTLAAPTSPTNAQQLRISVLASGGARTVTFSGVAVSTGLSLGAYSIPQNQIGLFLLTYSTLRTTPAWVLTSSTVSA